MVRISIHHRLTVSFLERLARLCYPRNLPVLGTIKTPPQVGGITSPVLLRNESTADKVSSVKVGAEFIFRSLLFASALTMRLSNLGDR